VVVNPDPDQFFPDTGFDIKLAERSNQRLFQILDKSAYTKIGF